MSGKNALAFRGWRVLRLRFDLMSGVVGCCGNGLGPDFLAEAPAFFLPASGVNDTRFRLMLGSDEFAAPVKPATKSGFFCLLRTSTFLFEDEMTSVMNDLMLPPEVAKYLRVSSSTLVRMVKRQEFVAPIRLSPKRIAFRRVEVERWIDSREAYPA